jgi:hypothetical protein
VFEELSVNYSAKTVQIARAIIEVESEWNPQAKNPHSTAKGLFQFLDGTWEEQCDGDPLSPADNISCGLALIEKGETWRWGSSYHAWLPKIDKPIADEIRRLNSCMVALNYWGVRVSGNAMDLVPNTQPAVGVVALFKYGDGVNQHHAALITDIEENGFWVRETNFKRGQETRRFVSWKDKNLRGFHSPAVALSQTRLNLK